MRAFADVLRKRHAAGRTSPSMSSRPCSRLRRAYGLLHRQSGHRPLGLFGVPQLGVDALKATHGMLSALWAYSDTLKAPGHKLVATASCWSRHRGRRSIAVPANAASVHLQGAAGEDLDAARVPLETVLRAPRPIRRSPSLSAIRRPATIASAARLRIRRECRSGAAPHGGHPRRSPGPRPVEAAPYCPSCRSCRTRRARRLLRAGRYHDLHTISENVGLQDYCDGSSPSPRSWPATAKPDAPYPRKIRPVRPEKDRLTAAIG